MLAFPLDVWSGGIAKYLGFRQLPLLSSSSKGLKQLLLAPRETDEESCWLTCCAYADSSHVRKMLAVAAKHGKTEYLRCLLKFPGAQQTLWDQHWAQQRLWERALGEAIWKATLGRHTSAVTLLLSNGAMANTLGPSFFSSSGRYMYLPLELMKRPRTVYKVYDGTPLTVEAILQHDHATLDVLLRAKAHINHFGNGVLPLHVAAHHDNDVAVKMLLKAGANVNAVDRGHDRVTPLLYAIKRPPDIYRPAEDNMRSIHDKRNRDTVKALLQGGANVNQAVRDVTPLLYAITQCSLYDKRGFDTVKTLLQGGAKVNEYGKTSGQWASPLIKAIEMQVRLVYACFADCRTVYSVSFLMCMYACALLHSCRTLYKS